VKEFRYNDMANVSNLVENFVKENDSLLIAVLEDSQKYYNYLPEETLREIKGKSPKIKSKNEKV